MFFKLFSKIRELIKNQDFDEAQQLLSEVENNDLAPAAVNLAAAIQKQLDRCFQKTESNEKLNGFNLIVIDEPNSYYGKEQHVWERVVNTLKERSAKKQEGGIDVCLVSHMEQYFLWEDAKSKVIESPWIGIIHNPFDIPDTYKTDFTNLDLFATKLWKESRSSCAGIVTFNEQHKNQLVKYFSGSVPVFYLPPPLKEVKQLWSYDRYIRNGNKKLIQTGYFLRNLHAIYEFPDLPDVDKYLVRYSEMPYFKEKFSSNKELFLNTNTSGDIDLNVKEISFLDERYFSDWLNENLVFIELCALANCSTLLECVAKGVPTFVNRLPAIESLLGKDYPLFYNSKDEIKALVSQPELLLSAHKHLIELTKTKFLSIDDYVTKLITIPLFQPKEESRQFKVTVVTVVMNMPDLLERTIKSVIGQNYPNLEYVVIDGGSTDGTLDIIKKYEKYIDVWVSEPDNGIYDAMNKGGRLASGIWVNFLNAGDTFVTNTTVSEMFEDVTKGDDLVYGDTIFQDDKGERVVEAREPEHLWQAMVFNHNALFKKRDLLLEHPFSDRYKIVADSEFIIWCYKQGKTFKNVGFPINTYESGGYADMNSVMRTVERWKVVSDYKLKPQNEINDYYFQRLLWESSCREYLEKVYKVKI